MESNNCRGTALLSPKIDIPPGSNDNLTMADIKQPDKVKLVCGMIAGSEELLGRARGRLEELYGPADVVSEVMAFDFTRYYQGQMGEGLLRQFLAFEALIEQGGLAAIKRATNDIEADFAAEPMATVDRPVNLDPGYVALSKLILASMKDFSHRIYLGGGVYGEVTLQYRDRQGWLGLPWTFPDYGSGRYFPFLNAARQKLQIQVKQEACSL